MDSTATYLGCTGESIAGLSYADVEAQLPDMQVAHRILGRIPLGLRACHGLDSVLSNARIEYFNGKNLSQQLDKFMGNYFRPFSASN